LADSSLTGPDDMVELRVLVKRKYIDVIDAVAIAQKPGEKPNRGPVTNQILAEWSARVRHTAMLVTRMERRNGTEMEEPWKNSAWHSTEIGG